MHHERRRSSAPLTLLAVGLALAASACATDEVDPALDDLALAEPDLVAPDDDPAEVAARRAIAPDEPGGRVGEDDLGTPTAAAYSPWIYIAGYRCGVYLRYCKTSTRINWQFMGNTAFDRVSTFGDQISYLTSNISGVSSGSKYRTRAGVGITWVWDDFHLTGCGTISWGEAISLIPSC